MHISQIPFALVRKTSDELIEHAPTVILERGMKYFRMHHVRGILAEKNIVTADVVGSNVYHVEIDLGHFLEKSVCACPYEGLCKHMVAVVFTLYAEFRDPAYLMQFALQGNRNHASEPMLTQRPGNMTTKPEPQPIHEHSSIEALLHFVEDSFEYADMPKLTYWDINRYANAVESGVNQLLTQAVDWSVSQRSIYNLFVFLLAMRRIAYDCRLAAASSPFFGGQQISEAIDNLLMDRFVEALDKFTPDIWDGLLLSVGDRVREHLRVVYIDNYRLRLGFWGAFTEFWRRISTAHSAFSREIHQIQTELDQSLGGDKHKHAALTQALQCLWILSDEDGRVQTCFESGLCSKETAEETLRNSMMMLDLLMNMEAYARVQTWLSWLLPYVKVTNIFQVHRYCEKWVELAAVYPVDESCIEILRKYKIRAAHIYTEYLIQTERDREWVSFHLAQKHLPNETNKRQLKMIESRNITLLLPMYHHGVERLIETKNRKAYKSAVKLMKKLATYYKKLKCQDKWQQFVEDFCKRNSRLRALQEEMRKGRLIA